MNHIEKIRGNEKIKNIIFIAEGGMGKVICSTAIVKRLKEEFPEKRIIVMSGYPDIYLYNPHVYKVFNMGNTTYFYDDYVNSSSYILKIEPYVQYEYIAENQHIIDVWCEQIGMDRKEAMPELFYLDNEISAGKMYVDKLTGNGKKKFILLQWQGGIVPKEKNDLSNFDAKQRMHRRSLPKEVAQKLANKLSSRKYVVACPQHEKFMDLNNVEKVFFPIRNVIVLLKFSDGFIGIDSFLQHAGKAMGVKGVVCWAGTDPKKLGYDLHANLTKNVCPTPHCHRPDSYTFDTSPTNSIWNCPHNEKCVKYDADEILEEYEKHFNKATKGKKDAKNNKRDNSDS